MRCFLRRSARRCDGSRQRMPRPQVTRSRAYLGCISLAQYPWKESKSPLKGHQSHTRMQDRGVVAVLNKIVSTSRAPPAILYLTRKTSLATLSSSRLRTSFSKGTNSSLYCPKAVSAIICNSSFSATHLGYVHVARDTLLLEHPFAKFGGSWHKDDGVMMRSRSRRRWIGLMSLDLV